ncbi:polyhydroxyalkanoate synthesis regulator DNA-binding domain-containing protein [candidate division CSSED10-310 bacterium]|uniref:Polyhydroxyalkanoate synthesis regulator DNA-binding domain-containing protein n=1 Tax=candidate division CSSED10-310 bacterium TaxID=2855610 RepID=A0ABV6YRF2_UNCC1
MPRVIKKYSNRKLYDVEQSKYVTLEEVGKLVEQGIDVKVIDNETGEDLSRKTLAHILLNLEKKQKSFLPFPILKDMIHKGGDSVIEYTKRSIMAGLGAISAAEDEIEKVVRRFTEKGLVTEDEAKGILKDFLSSIEKSKINFDKKIEESTVKVLKTLPVPSRNEVSRLNKRISELEKRIVELEKSFTPHLD